MIILEESTVQQEWKFIFDKMKKIYLVWLFLSSFSFAQTGIGTSSPNSSARLEVAATDRGFLPPRIALTAANSASPVISPANGLLIFNTASSGSTTNRVTPGYYFWDGGNSRWQRLASDVNIGDIKTGMQTADHNGWIRLDGRAISTLTASQQAQATALGIGTNLPDATNAVLMQTGGTLGNINGNMNRTLAQNQLPNISPSITISQTTDTMQNAGAHQHAIGISPNSTGGYANGFPTSFKYQMFPNTDAYSDTTDRGVSFYATTSIIGSAGDHTHTMNPHIHTASATSINGGVAQQSIDITPRNLSVNTFIYLGL